jgi:hypothetical protein
MFTEPHKHPLLRRVTGSIVGALLSLTVYSIYEDVSMAIRLHAMAANTAQHEAATEDPAVRIKAFAEELKQKRVIVSPSTSSEQASTNL